jgi:transcriptional regulator with PAS, ATPase and Fis domain
MLLDEIQVRSSAFSSTLALIRRVANTNTNILLAGETGSGKDFVAGLIHDASPRRAAPFLKIDCASIPSSLAESEFFGYEKGAFSDAFQASTGKLRLADGGTLYFDGINHLPARIQSKLLRFVQEKTVEPLGGSKSYSVDCRLIASCTVPVKTCLKEKQLREDLYYRLAGVLIELPPLRNRIEDVELLTREILREFAQKYRKNPALSEEAIKTLKEYTWPGNIRELRNVLEHAVIHGNQSIHSTDFVFNQSISDPSYLSFAADRMISMEDLEKRYITEVLKHVRGHLGKAAAILNINRKTLLEKRKKYGIGIQHKGTKRTKN